MNAPVAARALLSADAARRFEREIAKYPPEHKVSAVIACLAVLQKEHGHVSQESEELVAQALGMPVIAVHEVTTFYNMFNQKPVGRFKLNVCTNLPCQLRGGQHALEHLCASLGVEEGGTRDGVSRCRRPSASRLRDAPVMLSTTGRWWLQADDRPTAGRHAAPAKQLTRHDTDPRSFPLPGHRPGELLSRSPHIERRSTPALTARTGASTTTQARRLQAIAKILEQGTARHDAGAGDAEVKASGCAAAAARAFRR